MRLKFIASATLACSALAVAAAPVAAEARSKERVLVCENQVRRSANTGTVVGAVAGGLLGNAVAGHGVKTEGTLLGAGVGAVAGHEIGKHNARQNCRYVYRYR